MPNPNNTKITGGAAYKVYIVGSDPNSVSTDGAGGGIAVQESGTLTYAALQTAAMGNAGATEVVPANPARRGLVLMNYSDTTGYFSFGSGVGLTTAGPAAFMLLPFQTYFIDPPNTQQAIYAVCGAAAKNISYQEAT